MGEVALQSLGAGMSFNPILRFGSAHWWLATCSSQGNSYFAFPLLAPSVAHFRLQECNEQTWVLGEKRERNDIIPDRDNRFNSHRCFTTFTLCFLWSSISADRTNNTRSLKERKKDYGFWKDFLFKRTFQLAVNAAVIGKTDVGTIHTPLCKK